MNYILRKANVNDVRFLSKVIIEAEKSGGDKIGLANIFDLTELEFQTYLIQILEEEIEGCEFSVSSFIIAEYNTVPIAAFSGWIEGENEDELQSAILKSNLISMYLPNRILIRLKNKQEFLKDLLIEREAHTHQLEYLFVDENHRRKGLTNRIIEELIKIAKEKNPRIKKSQVQVYENNLSAIRAYERSGYKKTRRQESSHLETLYYLPWNVKLLMEKEL